MDMGKKETILKKILLPFLGLAIFLVVWLIAAKLLAQSIILPSPIEVLKSLWSLLGQASFYEAVANTTWRSLQSYFIAFLVALVIAIISSINDIVEKVLSPLVVITRATPTMSIILLALIWLTSKTAPMLVAFLVIFPLLYTGILNSIKRVDKGLIDMSKIYKVPIKDRIFKLYLRETLPPIFTLLESTISFNLKLIIAGEVLAYTSASMGFLMQRTRAYLDTATLLAWTAIAVIVGYILEIIVILTRKLVVKWER